MAKKQTRTIWFVKKVFFRQTSLRFSLTLLYGVLRHFTLSAQIFTQIGLEKRLRAYMMDVLGSMEMTKKP